jgi:hypothetical protein
LHVVSQGTKESPGRFKQVGEGHIRISKVFGDGLVFDLTHAAAGSRLRHHLFRFHDRSACCRGHKIKHEKIAVKAAMAYQLYVPADLLDSVLVIASEITGDTNEARCRPLYFGGLFLSVTLQNESREVAILLLQQ